MRAEPQKKWQVTMKARLRPLTNGSFSVIFDGKLLVERSRDPECDAARALLAQGVIGKLTLCDGKTGIPRAIIDIERTARLCVKEGPLRFAPYESRPDRAYSLESDAGGHLVNLSGAHDVVMRLAAGAIRSEQ
jgi:hypothetical protein